LTDVVEKGFLQKDGEQYSIQSQARVRSLDSKNRLPRFDKSNIQFHNSISDTFSTNIDP